MSFLNAALLLAEKGFHVFPLITNSKLPLIKDFPKLATKDEAQIRKWWTDSVMEIERPYNIGISTSEFNCTASLIVVDVDNKGKKKGDETLFKLEMEGKFFPKTFTQVTPTGGRHLVYKWKEPMRQGVDKLGSGLDIRAMGGYIAGAGSEIDGKPYTLRDFEIADCPEWIVNSLQKPKEKEVFDIDLSDIDHEAAFERAKFYLQFEAPISIEGNGGDSIAFQVAAKVKDFGVTPDTALALLSDYWNEKCEPPWGIDDLQTKVDRAFKYGKENPGSSSPEADFSPIVEFEKSYLDKINTEFSLIFGEGDHRIMRETLNHKNKKTLSFMNERQFKRYFSTQTIFEGKKLKTYAEVWLDWKGRRQYNGLVFKPELEAPEGFYNLWRGFACKETPYDLATKEAKEGFDLFMDHAKNNICQGDQELFDWLIGYFAHLIQKPYEKPLTTLVFKGTKGVGKNALMDRVGKLLGNKSYLVAHDSRYLTSNFNGHLDSCLCLVLDEAFWSGDKGAESKLKGITTAPELMIERKGQEAYTVDNYVRLVVIGNEDWIVPASFDERRYAVFKVGENKKKDQNYFSTMRVNIDDLGGNEVLLHFLKNFDLSKVNVNSAPDTIGLVEQKVESLNTFENFWYNSLSEGRLLGHDSWPEQISREEFKVLVKSYFQEQNIRSRFPSPKTIGRNLKRVCPSRESDNKIKDSMTGKWSWSYKMPTLEMARKEFEGFLGQKVIWED